MKNNMPYNVLRHRDWEIAPRMPQVFAAVIASATGLAATSFVVQAFAYLAYTAVSYLAMRALTPKLGAQNKGTLFNVREPTAAQRYIYGQVRTGGVLTYIETTGANNKYLHQVITLAGHPVEEIGDIYINDEVFARANSTSYNYVVNANYWQIGGGDEFMSTTKITLNGCTTNYAVDATLTEAQLDALMAEAGYDYTSRDFRGGKIRSKTTDTGVVYGDRWQNKIRINAHDGTQTEVDHDLFDETSIKYPNGDSTQTPYANYAACPFIGEGIPYLYIRYEYDAEIFSNGLPNVTVVIKGKKVENTSGVPQTYPASANAALVIRDYIKSAYGLDDSYVDDTYFAAAAVDCNDDITLAAGGTEKRYQINGVVSADVNTGETLQEMAAACNGTLYISGGEWRLKVGVYEASQKSFTLDDLRSEISLPTRRSRRDNFNKVVGRFVNGGIYDADSNPSAGDWVEADYPAITSSAFLTEDNNIENIADLPLMMVTSASQAQRVAKQTLFRSREQITLSAEFGTRAINLEVGDTIDLTISEYGWTNKEFEVASWALVIGETGGLRVRMTLRETSEAAFDWAAEESAIINNNSTLPSYWIVPAPEFLGDPTTQTVILPDGTTYSTATIEWDHPAPEQVEYYIVAYNRTAGGSDTQQLMLRGTSLEISDAEIGEDYTITVTAVSAIGVRSDTIIKTVTIPEDATPPSAPTITSVTGGYKQIAVSWTNPEDADLKEVQVYSNTTNDSGTATLVGTVTGSVFIHTGLPDSTTRYYWTKAVDFTGNISGFSSAGSSATLASPAAGEAGANGDTVITGRVYYQTLQSTSPSAPSATSYNTSTGQFVGLTSGWSQTQPSVDITDTSVKEWSSQFIVTIDGDTGTQAIAFNAPTGAIQVAADIESDNYVAGVSGWHIERDTGFAEFGSAAIRGTLSVGQIPTLTSAKISDLAGVATSGSYNDLSSRPDLSQYATVTQLNSKTKVFSSASAPTAEAVGDLWYDTLNDNFKRWSGSAWVAISLIADSVVSSYVYAGEINAAQITTGLIQADQIKLDGVTLDTDGAGNVIVASDGIGTNQLADAAVITSTIAARAATDASVASVSTLTLTSLGSTSLGSFTTTEASQFIIIQASANAYGTGTGTTYSLSLTIDGVAYAIFVNSSTDSYATYNDLRFPISILDRRVISSAGSHTLGLSYVVSSGNTLELTNLDVVITLLKR